MVQEFYIFVSIKKKTSQGLGKIRIFKRDVYLQTKQVDVEK